MREELPANLPVPGDDGACDHLPGWDLPDISLYSTAEQLVRLKELSGRLVIYCYPMTGRPGQPLPNGWEEIPGARGCTAQACSFRDHFKELQQLNAMVYGLSTQSTAYQKEAKERLHLPFHLLSDEHLSFASALKLPLFQVEQKTLIKRVTLIFQGGKIIHYIYPVFPPDKNVEQVLDWLQRN